MCKCKCNVDRRLHGPMNETNINGTHPAMLTTQQCNSDEDTQRSYACDYQNKRQPCVYHEVRRIRFILLKEEVDHCMASKAIGCKTCKLKIQSEPLWYLEQGAHNFLRFIASSSKAKDEANNFLQLVDFWMHYPRPLRKSISRHGVIRSTVCCHPKDKECVELNCGAFDAGRTCTHLYGRSSYTYKDETWSELTKSFLPMGLGTFPMDDPVAFPMNIDYAAMLLELLVQDFYAVLYYFPQHTSILKLSVLQNIVSEQRSMKIESWTSTSSVFDAAKADCSLRT